MELFAHPHKRLNILTGEWVLVSPHRTKRPWKGKIETPAEINIPAYDPGCYLCPGNTRAGGIKNPDYDGTFVFENDFAALYTDRSPNGPDLETTGSPLLRAERETGVCKVICYTPQHNRHFAQMDLQELAGVVDLWCSEYKILAERQDIGYVQIFENRGAQMGCSNPHPHGQIWANSTIPGLPGKETARQADYSRTKNKCLLCDYLETELSEGERIIIENNSFAALVPFWAFWPFETMILPKRHISSVTGMTPGEKTDLAEILNKLVIRYDNLFEIPFPYSMGIHQQPVVKGIYDEWHFHFHFFPPLLRSATISKFIVGYELLAMPQRDISAEYAAAKLREQKDILYIAAGGEENE